MLTKKKNKPCTKWSKWRITVWILAAAFAVLFVPFVKSVLEYPGSGGFGLSTFCILLSLFNMAVIMIDNTVLVARLFMNRISTDFFVSSIGINITLFFLAMLDIAILMQM